MGDKFASIDLGTNSCRLLIVEKTAKGLKTIYNDSAHVRLGDKLAETRNITAEASYRTLNLLKEFSYKMKEFEVKDYRFIATAAMRMADNRYQFMQKVKDVTGLDIDLISPEEEARLTVMGAKPNIKKSSEYVVLYDIGGGSSEVILAEVKDDVKIIDMISIPFGSATSSQKLNLIDYNKDKYNNLINKTKTYLFSFEEKNNILELAKNHKVQFIAASSTAIRIAAFDKKLEVYKRIDGDNHKMDKKAVKSTIKNICKLSFEQRKNHALIGKARADIIISGCAIFEAIFDFFNAKEVTSCFKGAKEGIVEELSS